ncbi:MAG TPA: 3'-5' exonuclease [Gemmatimonadales bacterium]|nr:3'-5' exonuclease [Gemmatimonadales bacterium]
MSDPLETMARELDASGRFRVLRRFERPTRYEPDDGSPRRTAVVVDVETTGLSPAHDAIIQFCGVPLEYCPSTGRVFRVGEAVAFLEDPGRPIPPTITALTGLTDAMVAGRRIDEARVAALVEAASLVIAHNAEFDRPFVERRLPVFRTKPWACSLVEVPWHEEGVASKGLDYLLWKRCGMFFDAHRADADCYALVHLLATPFPSGRRPLALLLDSARRRTVRIWALGAPIELKDLLKARRYRWCPGGEGVPRAWYVDLPESMAERECAWLAEHVYHGRGEGWRTERFDARTRYSERMDPLARRAGAVPAQGGAR